MQIQYTWNLRVSYPELFSFRGVPKQSVFSVVNNFYFFATYVSDLQQMQK